MSGTVLLTEANVITNLALLGTTAAGGTAAFMGAADTFEGIANICSGLSGGEYEAPHFIRDTLFEENPEAYYIIEAIVSQGAVIGEAWIYQNQGLVDVVDSYNNSLANPTLQEQPDQSANSQILPDGKQEAGEGESSAGRGILIGKLDGLTADERKVVNDLLDVGYDIEVIPRSNTDKTPN